MLAMFGVFACRATIVPRLSLEEIVARSETIVSGQVTRVWTAWDSPHRFIWTHTEILVSNVAKGNRMEKLVVSEPGGVVDGLGMQIAGTPGYTPGEQVMLFLERMPNGYLRTAGMGQGSSPSRRMDGYISPTPGPMSPIGQSRPTERRCKPSMPRTQTKFGAAWRCSFPAQVCVPDDPSTARTCVRRPRRLELHSPRPHGRQSSPRRRIQYPVPGQPEDHRGPCQCRWAGLDHRR